MTEQYEQLIEHIWINPLPDVFGYKIIYSTSRRQLLQVKKCLKEVSTYYICNAFMTLYLTSISHLML